MKALTWKTQTKLKGDRDSTERQKLIKKKKIWVYQVVLVVKNSPVNVGYIKKKKKRNP